MKWCYRYQATVRCPTKLVSSRNNLNDSCDMFCFGCFASISEQCVLVFRLNRASQFLMLLTYKSTIFLWFRETDRKSTETDRVSVRTENFSFFVCFVMMIIMANIHIKFKVPINRDFFRQVGNWLRTGGNLPRDPCWRAGILQTGILYAVCYFPHNFMWKVFQNHDSYID
jgi:hypothetical protein